MYRFLFGIILGAAVGVVAGAMLASSERVVREPVAGKDAGDLAPAAQSPWQVFRQRLAEAAQAGTEAARETEQEMRARHRELTKRDKK
jgi:hypothetical protein